MATAKTRKAAAVPDMAMPQAVSEPEERASSRAAPYVFISHDSRDADLAAAFENLLTDASGGVIQTFRSSDQSGKTGIEYGENWYSRIAQSLSEASDVVALLTPNSTDRPWILFEAGWAVGRLNAKVFGVAMGIPLARAVTGPFAQFQNCEANEESLTGVVLQLIRRNQTARPREQAVRLQVGAFLKDVEPMLDRRNNLSKPVEDRSPATVAKLFEEVKVMFRDLSERVEQPLSRRKRSRPHPAIFDEIFHTAFHSANPSLAWLLVASALKDEVTWLAEPTMDMYRAVRSGSQSRVQSAGRQLIEVVRMSRQTRMMYGMLEDEETFYYARQISDMLEHFARVQAESSIDTDAVVDGGRVAARRVKRKPGGRGQATSG